jgi:hypothetical protein
VKYKPSEFEFQGIRIVYNRDTETIDVSYPDGEKDCVGIDEVIGAKADGSVPEGRGEAAFLIVVGQVVSSQMGLPARYLEQGLHMQQTLALVLKDQHESAGTEPALELTKSKPTKGDLN